MDEMGKKEREDGREGKGRTGRMDERGKEGQGGWKRKEEEGG